MTETDTELLIIGGGPGGLGAATTFARTLRPYILYDSGAYRNGSAVSHTVMGYDGAEIGVWRGDVRRDLAGEGEASGSRVGKEGDNGDNGDNGEIRFARITSLVRTATGFAATDDAGRKVAARKVVLATGVRDVLPDIPGLAQHWGTRALHCLFCHGTETAGGRIGFLLSRHGEAVVTAMLTMWARIPHSRRVVLTNGAEVESLARYKGVLAARGIEIITEPITSISPSMTLELGETTLELDYIMLAPTVEASAHARALLTPALLGLADLGPGGTLPPPHADAEAAHMPVRGGADPRTAIRGLFWAGNAGSPHANVSMAAAQGQIAGVVAADEIGGEELEREMEKSQ